MFFVDTPEESEVEEALLSDWSIKIRSEFTRGEPEEVVETVGEAYTEALDKDYDPQVSAYMMGLAAGKILDENPLEEDEVLGRVVDGVMKSLSEYGVSGREVRDQLHYGFEDYPVD